MSYTVYHTYYYNTSRPTKTISCPAATCKYDFCDSPMEILRVILNNNAANIYVLAVLSIYLNLH